ncbi:MAG TPA: hypothetical protein VF719_13845 [Abditibacteriaceae bacterium]
MIRNTHTTVLAGLGVAAIGFALTGCGQNATNTATAPTKQNATDDHAHAPGEAPHSHEGETAHKHNTGAEMAKFATWFPGSTVTQKPFPLSADAASHLSEDSGLKFTGAEKDWSIYEAAKEGQRVGFAVVTHATDNGGEMHLDYAVDRKFTVIRTDISKAPDKAKIETFAKQFKGKKFADAWKVGKDLKATPGLAPATAQAVADTVKKGLAILDSNFNASHSH